MTDKKRKRIESNALMHGLNDSRDPIAVAVDADGKLEISGEVTIEAGDISIGNITEENIAAIAGNTARANALYFDRADLGEWENPLVINFGGENNIATSVSIENTGSNIVFVEAVSVISGIPIEIHPKADGEDYGETLVISGVELKELKLTASDYSMVKIMATIIVGEGG